MSCRWHLNHQRKELSRHQQLSPDFSTQNAYGSVPHDLIYQSLDFFHIPEKIMVLLQTYSDSAFMHFPTQRYTTNWQALEVGIMMGCVISPLLFNICMEMLLWGAKDASQGEVLDGRTVLPPMEAFLLSASSSV